MMINRTISDILRSLPIYDIEKCPTPPYTPSGNSVGVPKKIALAVPSMAKHMSDEGWQLMLGLREGGKYLLCSGLNSSLVDVPHGNVRTLVDNLHPEVVVVQDKREWDHSRLCTLIELFTDIRYLREREDIFKVTVLKDAHQRPEYHKESAVEMGCHAWIIYYSPEIVMRLAPYLRRQHLIRVYHTIDSEKVPAYSPTDRKGCLLSGMQFQRVYPLRYALLSMKSDLPEVNVVKHPGYHRRGTNTPNFLRVLSRYKVAICTSSIYGYALRKTIEATACGCIVITDLPVDEQLPYIDGNLVRIDPCMTGEVLQEHMSDLLNRLYREYEPERQSNFASLARSYYDYRIAGRRLFEDIERMRANYNVPKPHDPREELIKYNERIAANHSEG